ncbi:MAG TPA: alpha/beta hydrolase [Steroidobacteraceae bacterium]|nr:alpha/beta hydrolase [Steroidobacteraceae bacterium]
MDSKTARSHSCLAYLTILLAGLCFAKEQPPALNKEALEQARRPIVLSVPGMDRVLVHSNLVYTQVSDPLVRMDIYVPPDLQAEERRPFVVLIHGGVPHSLPVKDMGAYRSWGRLIAAQGMVAVTFTHRLRWPLKQVHEAAADVRAAIDFARANSAKFNTNPDRLCIAAYSAGGPLLTVALQDERSYVRCQLAMYALVDAQGFGVPEEAKFALKTYLGEPSFPPLFLARAGRDTIPTLNMRLDAFVGSAIGANAPITVMNHPNGMHGFDVANDDERSREIIRAAIEFMKTHLH